MASAPSVSVIVPTFNRRAYLLEALESLRAQTLAPAEILVVDDGSSDGSAEAVEALDDPRIRVIRHALNRGISAARNTGLYAARGEFLAWLDSDDLARPQRLLRQARFLQLRPEVVLVGCCAGKLAPTGEIQRGLRIPPFSHEAIAAWLLFRPPFQQSGVMGRTAVLQQYPYREDLEVCEDFDVFLRMSARETLRNVPEVLIDRRLHPQQTIRRHEAQIRQRKAELLRPALRELGLEPSDQELADHVRLGQTRYGPQPPIREFLAWAEDWLLGLRAANARTERFDARALNLATSYFWALACRSSAAVAEAGPRSGIAALCRSRLTGELASAPARAWLAAAAPLLITAIF